MAVKNTGNISKKDLILNDALPEIEVNPETYEVRADGELLTCQPADVVPIAQRYFFVLTTEFIAQAIKPAGTWNDTLDRCVLAYEDRFFATQDR